MVAKANKVKVTEKDENKDMHSIFETDAMLSLLSCYSQSKVPDYTKFNSLFDIMDKTFAENGIINESHLLNSARAMKGMVLYTQQQF